MTIPPDDRAQGESSRQTFTGTLLVVMTCVVTVLGAILLSLQGQTESSQPIALRPEGAVLGFIPTAAVATLLPLTSIPTIPPANPFEPLDQTARTPLTGPQDTAPAPSPTIGATPILLATTTAASPATPWPCAGGAPLNWRLYIVQPGDTLFSLARRHGTSMYLVIYYNCLNSDQLWVGQRLYLPALPTLPPATVTLTALPSFTPTPTNPFPSPTLSLPSPTATPGLTVTASPLPSATATGTSRPTPVLTVTPTPTLVPSETATVAPTGTATSTPTGIPTSTPTTRPMPSATPSPSFTPAATLTPSPSVTETPRPTSEP